MPSKNRYLYNGKEVQREVFGGYPLGWYDYGARGLNSDFCRFMSVDPMAQMYYPISPYVYCLNNPIKFVDPDGRKVESAWDVFSLVSGVHNLVGNVRLGNVKGAVADGLGIVIDAFAVVAPGIPGGVGAVRAADKVVDAGKVSKVPHGNSKQSTKAQHNYDVVDTETGKRVKTGVSGGKVNKKGESVRGESQAKKWNKEEGKERKYKSVIVNEVPAGEGSRQKALDFEEKRAFELKEKNELKDKKRHIRP